MLKRLFMILVILVIVLGGGLYAYKELMPPVEQEVQGPVYSTKEVVRGDISIGVETTGQLNPSNSGGLTMPGSRTKSSNFQIVIEEYLVEEGDELKQGQLVAKLSSPNLFTKIEEKEEELENKINQLSKISRTPAEEIDNLDPSKGITIISPISGRMINLDIEQGNELDLGQTIGTVVDDTKYVAEVKAFKAEFDKLKTGQKVLLDFSHFQNQCEAFITEKNPNRMMFKKPGDEFATSFIYEVGITGDNPGLVQPGMKASLIINDNNGTLTSLKNKAEITGYVDQHRLMNTTVKAIVTELHTSNMAIVEKGDPILTMAGNDIQELFQEKLNEIRELRNELRDLESQTNNLEIRAPMDGIVARLNKQAGENVTPGEWIGHLYTVKDMRIWAQIDDIDILNVKQGARTTVRVDAIPDKTFEGEVGNVSTMGTDINGIAKFRVEIKVQGSSELRPGMQARVFIHGGSAENVLLVPLEAIFEEDTKTMVEILDENGTPEIVQVKLGLMNDRVAEVKSGLSETDKVVTGSSADLLPSQHIKDQGGLLPGSPDNGDDDDGDNGNRPAPVVPGK